MDRITWELYTQEQYDEAMEAFRRSTLYRALKRDADRMAADCKGNFPSSDRIFWEEWERAAGVLHEAEKAYGYRRGLRDGAMAAIALMGMG